MATRLTLKQTLLESRRLGGAIEIGGVSQNVFTAEVVLDKLFCHGVGEIFDKIMRQTDAKIYFYTPHGHLFDRSELEGIRSVADFDARAAKIDNG
jgi:hypothetical protein